MFFGVLGPLRVDVGGVETVFAASRERTVLAALLLEPNEVVPVDDLVDTVWGEDPPATARGQIHTCVSRLRRSLRAAGVPESVVATDPAGYRITVAPDELDSLVFARQVTAARADAAAGRLVEARTGFRAALGLWRGTALPGLVSSRVIEIGVARLEEQRWAAVEDCVDLELRLGLEHELVGELTGQVERYPLRERLRGQLMVALYRVGRQADALGVYRAGRRLLNDELGLEPDVELRELHRKILNGDPSLLLDGRAVPMRARVADCLPRDIIDFTGREEMVARLLAAVPAHSAESAAEVSAGLAAPVILAIDGMAGMGKTALAVRVAHLVAAGYPDGRLFVDLHGHSDQAPTDPGAALGTLLCQLGVAPGRVPASLDERVSMWRTELADRRVLVVLDNAADTVQVWPLLPSASRCLVLVTSRRRLVGLDGAYPISLEVLPSGEAIRLVTRIVGDRVVAEREAAHEVVRLCGHLPLAIRIAAARLAHRPQWSVADLVVRLRAADPLAELAADGRSVAAAFTLSYRHLTESGQRLFRLLGLHPGAGFDAHAAACLAEVPVDVARDVCEDLVDVHLLEAPSAGRYRLHDLIRDYARGLVAKDPEPVRRGALTGMFDYYLHTTAAATAHLEQAFARAGLDIGAPSRHVQAMPEPERAEAWLDVEWRNVVASVHHADGLGWHRYTWQLTRALWILLWRRGHGDVSVEIHERALRAALALGDDEASATMHNYLASGYSRLGRSTDALTHLLQALDLRRRLGNDLGRLSVLINLSRVYLYLGRFVEAEERVREAIGLSAELGIAEGAVIAPNILGIVHMRLGLLDQSLDDHRRRWAAVRQLGNRYEEAVTLGEIGAVHHRLGHHRLAVLLLGRARAMKRETGNRNGEAETLSELGSAYRGLGRLDQALARHREALALMHEVGDPIGECLGLNDLGATQLAAGAREQASDTFRLALSRAERTQNRYEQARAHEGIAAATASTAVTASAAATASAAGTASAASGAGAVGDPEETRWHRQRARELFEEMATPGPRETPRRLTEIPVQPARPVPSAPKR